MHAPDNGKFRHTNKRQTTKPAKKAQETPAIFFLMEQDTNYYFILKALKPYMLHCSDHKTKFKALQKNINAIISTV